LSIGFIGLGIMGESMSENLIKKSGQIVYVYDVDKSKIEKLVDKGAKAAENIEDIAKNCEVIFSMVPKSEHVRMVAKELIPHLKTGQIWVDMSTIEPEVSREIAKEVQNKGAVMLDAPVVKSKAAAISGTLGIYVGGDKDSYERVKPYLSCMGSDIIYLGSNGMGLNMKIIHNMLVAQIQNSVNEMFVFAKSLGMNLNDVVEAISYGGGQNFYLDTKHKAIINKDFTTAFSVANMYKDVNIAFNMMKNLGLNLKGFNLVKDIYDRAVENYSDKDFSATYLIVSNEVGDGKEYEA
jgi:3-hydroxyisobutyrate dehydrogenase-like beta-hydroxyacid dehydrogenase